VSKKLYAWGTSGDCHTCKKPAPDQTQSARRLRTDIEPAAAATSGDEMAIEQAGPDRQPAASLRGSAEAPPRAGALFVSAGDAEVEGDGGLEREDIRRSGRLVALKYYFPGVRPVKFSFRIELATSSFPRRREPMPSLIDLRLRQVQ
jgi:hypothetical protein